MKLKLGPGGTAGLGYERGIPEINRQGLSALEVEFTYGVNIKEDMAIKIRELAKKHNISLSVHAPYYVNLASDENAKRNASAQRIFQSCHMASIMGAKYVVFHPGFYQKKSPEEAFEIIKAEIIQLQEKIKENSWNVLLAPETTGKPTQFGTVEELMCLHKETGCHVCVDFAHLKARTNGEVDYFEVIEKIKPLGHIHAHFSGIEWTGKGEKKHLITEKEVIKPLAEAIIKNNLDITIINESPKPIEDAVKMKEVFDCLSK
ncbi:MAG: TIM barrel protein [Candidatus Nanoarchaeia archaeon]